MYNKGPRFNWYSQNQQLLEDVQLLSKEENETLLEAQVLCTWPPFLLNAIGSAIGNREEHTYLP